MRAGRLRHRLTLQSQTETRDAYGGSIITWSTEATVWGAIEPLSGREYFAQAQIQSEVAVRIVMRYRTGIDTTWRVKNDGLIYNIESVINDSSRDRMLTLMCREGVSDDQADAGTTFILNETSDFLLNELGDQLLLEA